MRNEVLQVAWWELALVVAGGLVAGQVVRLVLRSVLGARDRRGLRQGLRQLARSVALGVGAVGSFLTAGFVLLLAFGVLFGVAFAAGLGGETPGAKRLLLGLVGFALLVAALGVYLVVRLLIGVSRSAAEQRSRALHLGLERLTVANVAVMVIAAYAIGVAVVPRWAPVPEGCGAPEQGLVDQRLTRSYEGANELEAAGPSGAADMLGVVPPVIFGDVDMWVFAVRSTDVGGVDLQQRIGYRGSEGDLRLISREAVEAAGGTITALADESNRDVILRWQTADSSGTISITTCGGLRAPSAVTSIVRVGPERVGACVDAARQAACGVMYEAAAVLTAGEGLKVPAERLAPPSLTSVSVDLDRLVLDQPPVEVTGRPPTVGSDGQRLWSSLISLGWEDAEGPSVTQISASSFGGPTMTSFGLRVTLAVVG